MADLNRVKDPLEIAAASPDPVVRELALRYKRMKQELVVLDGLFDLYAKESAAMIAAPHAAKGNGTAARHAAPIALPASASPEDFDATVKALLADGPLSLDELHAGYVRRRPDDPRSREAMRVALQGRKAWIGRTPDKAYAVLTTGAADSHAAAA